ncbi:MAG TPA: hypothetical protein HA223_04515 [Nanoarchaeota archaeon]|nr:hypothetical protein [Nanoarchaeota archaeon]
MPYAVTHVIFALVIADVIRDYVVRDKKKFPLHYVLIAGIAGLLPDIDILFDWFSAGEPIHRLLTHTIFLPLYFLLLALATRKVKSKTLGKHKMKWSGVFYMLALGTLVHLLLDGFLAGMVYPLAPFSEFAFGLGLASQAIQGVSANDFLAGVDAIILMAWFVHEEVKHKISDFI